jgi:tetratricopeptide (TPR) repeat protein
MRHSRSRRCRAALFAAVSLSSGAATARDTAGPEPQRPPDAKPKLAAPAATPVAPAAAPPATADAAPLPHPLAPAAPASMSVEAPAPAPETLGSPDAERAKQLYALGAEAFAAQRNADAIRYFRRAAELVPSPKLTYNIGLAYEEMGDAGRALGEYRSYLDQEAESDPARRDDVQARIAHLERRLAETGVQQLRVKTEPPGATVRIAGRALGVTPWTGELAPGEHVVELELPGHTPQQARVLLPADHSAQLALELARVPPPDATPERSRWANVSPLTWTFLGVGTASLAGGVVFELSRASSSDAARRADDATAAAEAHGAADAKQMASLVLLGFGAGFSIGGSVLLALELSEASDATPDQAAFGGTCTPGFCGITAQGRF